MAPQEDDSKHICYDCIGDEFLAEEVKTNGSPNQCNYCSSNSKTITLGELSSRVHGVVEEHFVRTPSEPNWMDSILIGKGVMDVWLPDGQQAEYLIMDIANVAEEIAGGVADTLSGRYAYEAGKYGIENPYDSETHYEERSPDDLDFHHGWESFRSELMYRERFFPQSAEPVLAGIFGDLGALTTYDGTSVIREITPPDQGFSIWRARTAQSDEELTKILESPHQQLGPPPSSSAEVGRMNAKGVSVFYGAMDPDTCVAEVRPPVGSHVVLGRFRLLRQVKLLDLGALSKVFADASYFEPDYAVKKGRVAFIRHLVSEISRPVMPRDIDREYLPTQFVASYLAHRATPKLDGIIFPSSQTAGDGQNIVLFNHARGIEPYSLPCGSETIVYIDSPTEEEDDDDGIFIKESVPSIPPATDPPGRGGRRGVIRLTEFDERIESEDSTAPTLELDIESIEVWIIKRVSYEPRSRSVSRYQETDEDRKRLNDLLAESEFPPDIGIESESEGQY